MDAASVLEGTAQVVSGKWLIDGQELVQTDAEAGLLFFGDTSWTNYNFTVDFMRTKGDGAAQLVFRRVVRNSNLLGFGIGSNLWSLDAVEDGRERNLTRGRTHLVDDHKWYHARVSVHGNHIVCTVKDELGTPLVDVPGDDDLHLNGQVGLATEDGAFRFRNIKVTDLDGKILWEMPPESGGAGRGGR